MHVAGPPPLLCSRGRCYIGDGVPHQRPISVPCPRRFDIPASFPANVCSYNGGTARHLVQARNQHKYGARVLTSRSFKRKVAHRRNIKRKVRHTCGNKSQVSALFGLHYRTLQRP